MNWRLIETQEADAYTNMAVDEAILEAVAHGESPPTLRFYTWQPAAVSLGYFQRVADVNQSALQKHGFDLVRRMTGGRAILHQCELTYSLSAPVEVMGQDHSVLGVYLAISRGLLAGLAKVGVSADMQPEMPSRSTKGAVCFAVPSRYEIVWQGRKLVGSAQTRRSNAFLQHGSILLSADLAAICAIHGLPGEYQQDLALRMVTLQEILGKTPPLSELAGNLTAGMTEALGVTWQPTDLSDKEKQMAGELKASKYAQSGWLARR